MRLLPADPLTALEVRFLDGFFDLHVMDPMQHAVAGALTGDPVKRQDALAAAVSRLERAVDEARSFRPHFPLGAPDRD